MLNHEVVANRSKSNILIFVMIVEFIEFDLLINEIATRRAKISRILCI